MKSVYLIWVVSSLITAQAIAQASEANMANEERKHFKKPRFSRLDLDGNSLVTLEEFQQKPIPHGDHEIVFAHIDANGNGEITEQEFDMHRPPERHRRNPEY